MTAFLFRDCLYYCQYFAAAFLGLAGAVDQELHLLKKVLLVWRSHD